MKMSPKPKSGKDFYFSREYWDEVAEKMRSFYVENPFLEYKKRELLRLVYRWGDNKLNKKILKTDLYEEALSHDHIFFDLAKDNENIYGIDIAPNIVKISQERSKKIGLNPKLLVEDVRKMSFADKSFDLIISNSTLDHFPEIDVALKELNRVLKDDGILILTLHNKNNPLIYLLYKLMHLFKKYQVYAETTYSLKEIKKLTEEAGFVITDSRGIINFPPVLPTLINICYKGKSKFFKKISRELIRVFEFIGEKNTPLNYFTGYLIAIRGIKKEL